MEDNRHWIEDRQHWQDLLVAFVGAWLVASSWLLDFSLPGIATNVTTVDFVVTGCAALALGVAALLAYRMWAEWIGIAIGLWLVASPWILHFEYIPNALWNAITGGILIVGAAVWNLLEERRVSRA